MKQGSCHLWLCFLSCLGLFGFQLFLSRCFSLVVRLTKVRTANKVGSSGLLDFRMVAELLVCVLCVL